MTSEIRYSRMLGEDYACIDGVLYGPCSNSSCYGVCEDMGGCGDDDGLGWVTAEEFYVD